MPALYASIYFRRIAVLYVFLDVLIEDGFVLLVLGVCLLESVLKLLDVDTHDRLAADIVVADISDTERVVVGDVSLCLVIPKTGDVRAFAVCERYTFADNLLYVDLLVEIAYERFRGLELFRLVPACQIGKERVYCVLTLLSMLS